MAISPQDSVEFDPPPGFTKPTHVYGQEYGSGAEADQFLAPKVAELLKSMVGYRQRGVTLAAGQGQLPTGCALGQKTSDQKYYVYSAGASDGTQICLGFLRDSRDTGGSGDPSGKVAADALGNLVYNGAVDLTLISGTDTASLVAGTGGGIGSGATGIFSQLRGRVDGPAQAFIF
jgi:hypothetical protein